VAFSVEVWTTAAAVAVATLVLSVDARVAMVAAMPRDLFFLFFAMAMDQHWRAVRPGLERG
jgi:hypothetical protein